MIHVRVRQQDEIERWQLARPERRRNEAFGSECEHAGTHADASQQGWIGDQPDSEQVDEERRMTKPREGETIVRPSRRVGHIRRRRDGPKVTFADPIPEP